MGVKLIAVLVGLYVIYGVLMVALHPRLIYPFYPDDQVLPGFTRVALTGADGTEISVQESSGEGPVVLYFMGNVGSLAYFEAALAHYIAKGRHVIAMEYRGGAGRPGVPSETSLKSDALIAADYAFATEKPVVVHGFSLGTGLATYVSARRPVAHTILIAPYDRLCALMAARSRLPACWIPGVQKWRSLDEAAQIKTPILILHGREDPLIPPIRSQAFSDLPQVKRVIIEGASHNNMADFPEREAEIDAVFERLGG